MFDHKKNNIDIWNACFKIKEIPIFYIPYLSLSLNKEDLFTSYIPNIKYSNKYGLIFTAPYPIYLSKNILGNISPCYIPNIGIKLQTKIHYSIYPSTGLMILNIIRNNKINEKKFPLTKNLYNKLGNLSWQHNSITYKKWNFSAYYTVGNIPNYFEDCIKTTNNYINQKFICNYNNKNWDIEIAYLGIAHNNITKKNNYTAAPQLTSNSYYNFYIKNIPCTVKIFNQLTKFTPEIRSCPEAIRIHTEPSIYCQIHNYLGDLNIETKLRLTHYQQKNIYYYNSTQYQQYHLQNIVNRISPQFKIYEKIILKNKTHILKKYQHFLESKLQYLYIPYCFQKNIGIYDSSLIFIDHNNFFNDFIYSGLDRIMPANQITGNITMRYLDNTHELFYISIGQILNFSKYSSKNTDITIKRHTSPYFMLFSSIIHWNINDQWNTHIETQYDMQYHNLPFTTAILEYIGKSNYTLQTHYRYINAQYIQRILFNSDESIYQKAITQLGILLCAPIRHNWKINYLHYYNTKTKKLINHTISLQYYTPCWNINANFERHIIGFNKKKQDSVYDNTIKLNIKISHLKTNCKLDSCKILNTNMLPYQHIS